MKSLRKRLARQTVCGLSQPNQQPERHWLDLSWASVSFSAFTFAGTLVACSTTTSMPDEGELGTATRQVSQALTTGTYEIKAFHSGKCIDIDGPSTSDGANLHQWDCHGGDSQKWTITNIGGNEHTIVSVYSAKAMDADGGGGSGTNVHQWSYGGGANQKWVIEDIGGGLYNLKPVHDTGQCVDIQGVSTANGANVQTWACSGSDNKKFYITPLDAGGGGQWVTDFIDNFDYFDTSNWQDQILWVNDEDQCYVPNGDYNTREVSNGTLKLRVVNIGQEINCDNWDKWGNKHPNTRYMAGRIASKNRKEFVQGKWTARLRLFGSSAHSGQPGMFPAWWLLGARNNEPPVQEPDENVCWPLWGSGEIDIFEHHGNNGPDLFTGRGVKSLGYCDGGDWSSYQFEVSQTLDWSYHSYSVEWAGDNIIFRVDDNWVGEEPLGNDYTEPMFAILNYAKITNDWMDGEWGMEVNWVKHEYWQP